MARSNTERALPRLLPAIEQAVDLRSVPRPLLDLVEIGQVGDQRIGGLFVKVNVVGLRIGHGPDDSPLGAPSAFIARLLLRPVRAVSQAARLCCFY